MINEKKMTNTVKKLKLYEINWKYREKLLIYFSKKYKLG